MIPLVGASLRQTTAMLKLRRSRRQRSPASTAITKPLASTTIHIRSISSMRQRIRSAAAGSRAQSPRSGGGIAKACVHLGRSRIERVPTSRAAVMH